MKTIDRIASNLELDKAVDGLISDMYGPDSQNKEAVWRKVQSMLSFIERAAVTAKKVSISKKAPNRWSTHSQLTHRGLWGYPKVFVTDGTTTLPVLHRFYLVPQLVTYDYHFNPPSLVQVFETLDTPAVPVMFTQGNYGVTYNGSQHRTEKLGKWLQNPENCPKLHELNAQLQAEWDKQSEAFLKEADRYIDKLGGRQRLNFQNKLAKELGRFKCELTKMTPANMYEIFLFTRDHSGALRSLVNFCKQNLADAAFIDESDIETAMKLAEIGDVMKQ